MHRPVRFFFRPYKNRNLSPPSVTIRRLRKFRKTAQRKPRGNQGLPGAQLYPSTARGFPQQSAFARLKRTYSTKITRLDGSFGGNLSLQRTSCLRIITNLRLNCKKNLLKRPKFAAEKFIEIFKQFLCILYISLDLPLFLPVVSVLFLPGANYIHFVNNFLLYYCISPLNTQKGMSPRATPPSVCRFL